MSSAHSSQSAAGKWLALFPLVDRVGGREDETDLVNVTSCDAHYCTYVYICGQSKTARILAVFRNSRIVHGRFELRSRSGQLPTRAARVN